MKPGVLFLDDKSVLGGAQLSLFDIAQHYSESGRVVLFSDGPFRERLEQAGVAVEVSPAPRAMEIPRKGTLVQDLKAVPRVLKLVWRVARVAQGYDLLYANSPKALVVSALAGKIVKKPVIWHIRDMLTADDSSRAHRWLAVTLANHMIVRVIANSKATAAAFVESGGRTNSVRIVYNGIDPTPFESVTPAEVDALRRELNLAGVPVVGVFSRLAPWKGQHILLEALTHLPGVHALLVGEATLPEEYTYAKALREQAAMLGIADRVHFLGFRQDIPHLMRLSDIVVHTSVTPEPFGRVVVEGMLAHRPVVATRAGGVLEIIEDSISGVLVPPGDVKALTGALSDLLAHPDKAHAVAEAGRSVALRFSPQAMLEGVAQNVQQVVS